MVPLLSSLMILISYPLCSPCFMNETSDDRIETGSGAPPFVHTPVVSCHRGSNSGNLFMNVAHFVVLLIGSLPVKL